MYLPENKFRNMKKPWPREQALRSRLSCAHKGIMAIKCRSSLGVQRPRGPEARSQVLAMRPLGPAVWWGWPRQGRAKD